LQWPNRRTSLALPFIPRSSAAGKGSQSPACAFPCRRPWPTFPPAAVREAGRQVDLSRVRLIPRSCDGKRPGTAGAPRRCLRAAVPVRAWGRARRGTRASQPGPRRTWPASPTSGAAITGDTSPSRTTAVDRRRRAALQSHPIRRSRQQFWIRQGSAVTSLAVDTRHPATGGRKALRPPITASR
jgi:hypothetical protein